MREIEKRDASAQTAFTDPFSAFRTEIDRVFQSFFGPQFGVARSAETTSGGALTPTVDIVENETSLVIAAELPGMAEDDLEIAIKGDVLTLSGEKKFEKTSDEDDVHVVERRYGSIRRSFRLPETVDTESASANFENGVLKVTLPKKPEIAEKSRKISISKP